MVLLDCCHASCVCASQYRSFASVAALPAAYGHPGVEQSARSYSTDVTLAALLDASVVWPGALFCLCRPARRVACEAWSCSASKRGSVAGASQGRIAVGLCRLPCGIHSPLHSGRPYARCNVRDSCHVRKLYLRPAEALWPDWEPDQPLHAPSYSGEVQAQHAVERVHVSASATAAALVLIHGLAMGSLAARKYMSARSSMQTAANWSHCGCPSPRWTRRDSLAQAP